jgi:hypothetical protein
MVEEVVLAVRPQESPEAILGPIRSGDDPAPLGRRELVLLAGINHDWSCST